MLESLDEFFEGAESANSGGSLTQPQKAYDIAAGSGKDGSTTPRVFTRSFDELEESIKDLRLHHINLSTVEDGSQTKVKDFALRTPCLLPSPGTLFERREALCTPQRSYDRHRAQTVDERSGGLDAWLAESPSSDKSLGRAGSIRSRVLHRQHTL
jgi:hypothetical protein